MELKDYTTEELETELEMRKKPKKLVLANMSVLAYANNFTLWHYRGVDHDVMVENYFLPASDMARKNDLIICQDISGNKFLIVKEVSSTSFKVERYS